ncbi:LysR family transcriptional regulator [Agromyces rhizosphaerae]|uniref:LysR family transcriptional regulator n=1 Tax=Agromyces rhizosphaerae TaxID=88374 RepID=A0A9W6CVY2_9MICO|nr:LysR substrate-binding domain-containing protein [Agromyces rhizosphaerae]GLI27051.1 LysR family transcriptional regulator [Agromyces rhizosphaerae]
MLDVRRLRLLVELSQRGTLAAVADALAYSPSSVSQQLDQLAREAGVPLLEPAGRRVRLTPQALLLVEHARVVLDRLERAESDVAASLTTIAGTVRVAVFQSAAHALMPDALAQLARTHPDLRVELVERPPEQGLFDTVARDADLVIAEQYPGHTRPHHEGLDRVRLASDPIRLALPPVADASGGGVSAASAAQSDLVDADPGPSPAAERDALARLRSAAALPWVMEPEGSAARQWALQQCRAAGFEPDVRYVTTDLVAHIRLVRTGNAAALLPDLVWAGDAPSVRLHDLPGRPSREIFTATRLAAADRPGVIAVREALRATASEVASPSE